MNESCTAPALLGIIGGAALASLGWAFAMWLQKAERDETASMLSDYDQRRRQAFSGRGHWESLPPANRDLPRDQWHTAAREHRWVRED